MPSDLALRYRSVRNLVARSKATIRDMATARTEAVLHNKDIAPFGTVGVLDHGAGYLPRMPRGAALAYRNFKPGDHVRVLPSHGFAHYRGDEGTIDKIIPINKAWVESEKNGRIIVDLDDLEKIGDH